MAGGEDESYWCRLVFEEFEHSVVRLSFEDGFLGNGFVVYQDEVGVCLIMTCQHVLENIPLDATVSVCYSGSNDPIDTKIIHSDEVRDVALLRVDGMFNQTPIEFFDQPVTSGWNVVLLGFITLGSFVILEPGVFFGQIISPDNAQIAHNCTSKSETSGSPVILAGVNKVVGVHFTSSRGCGYAVPVGAIKESLGEWLGVKDMDLTMKRLLTIAAE